MTFQKRLQNDSGRKKGGSAGSGQVSVAFTLNLLHAVEQTHAEEYSCDDVLGLFGQLAEMVTRGEDPSQILPLVQEHLELCANCREELDALLRILEASPSL